MAKNMKLFLVFWGTAFGLFPGLQLIAGAAVLPTKCIAHVAQIGQPSTMTLDLAADVLFSGRHSFFLSVTKTHATDRPLTCGWMITDPSPLSEVCHPMKGYAISGSMRGQLNLTILKTTTQHLDTYTWSLQTFPGGNTVRTTCVLQAENDSAGSAVKCLAPQVQMGGSSTLTFDFGVTLGSVTGLVFSVSRNITDRPLMCEWTITDPSPLSEVCHPGKGYAISGSIGGQLNLTILNTTTRHFCTYTLSLQTFPGGNTVRTTCVFQAENGTSNTEAVTADNTTDTTSNTEAVTADNTTDTKTIVIVVVVGVVIIFGIIAVYVKRKLRRQSKSPEPEAHPMTSSSDHAPGGYSLSREQT